MDLNDVRIAVVGLGYVGLPLALAFSRKFKTIGYDIQEARVEALRSGDDATLEVAATELSEATQLSFSSVLDDIAQCNVYVVTVPTPIDDDKRPDLSPLVRASEAIGRLLKPGDTVIYESTVYPGCTEEVCVPVLERCSGLEYDGNAGSGDSRQSFSVGYSPERINPGDKFHRIDSITKVTSGSNPDVADFVDALYAEVVTAGTFKASSIKVAEASKVIENTQRDANIALVNEFAKIFNRLGIDTEEVLDAAATKWNFLPFKPGLVGGHCIGVDPYYLIQKAQSVGYYPDLLIAARRNNESMGQYVADETIKLMVREGINPVGARILILGLAFKENCPDLRNTRVLDIIRSLQDCNANVDVHDPWVEPAEAAREHGIDLVSSPALNSYDAVVIAVGHQEFKSMGAKGVRAFGKPERSVIYDVKHVLSRSESDGRL
ncbi:nucleotide sugar dehydrogenase [Lysobacter soyae]|uniref:Nucleotide sugar dehydrogenase n=1 Tax=Lysobacter soyae TaxID=2764185 RepID=A0ABX8WMR9_9GAMM|nr:nucleotide sugar dehydrogenase [Lysobacter sp. CJ11]QYR52400.1 nucleotide sugar dehydrogenase [Lysobacter sp. CJ11]